MKIYSFILLCLIIIFTPACTLANHAWEKMATATPTRVFKVVTLPTQAPTLTPTKSLPTETLDSAIIQNSPTPVTITAEPVLPEPTNSEPTVIAQATATNSPTSIASQIEVPQPNITATAIAYAELSGLIGRAADKEVTPTPALVEQVITGILGVIGQSDEPEDLAKSPARLPTFTPTPSATMTPLPSDTLTPTPLPTDTPIPTNTPPNTASPIPTNTPTYTPIPPPPPTYTPAPVVVEPESPIPTPAPEYDFLLSEFYNSPTTNHFLLIYVAIVDVNGVPIGDMKVLGTRLDHNLTYESPLSTWHFEGYNAPGEVQKSGNVKFEPPGGIEDTSWLLYLADANGNRVSEEIPFDTSTESPQWYFIEFKRKY